MAYIVTENCIKCKYTDCVEVCPVDCFYEGPNMLVINPDECIDCGVCESECPALAITREKKELQQWATINSKFSKVWPNIKKSKAPLPEADQFNGKKDKIVYLEDSLAENNANSKNS